MDNEGNIFYSTLARNNPGQIDSISKLSVQRNLSISFAGTGSGAVNISPPGSTCNSDCTESYDSGTTVMLTSLPDSLSSFVRWTGACSGTEGQCQVNMNEAKSVEAIFSDKSNSPHSIRKLSQTKYGVDNLLPMNDNNWENTKEDDADALTITHALYPFQIGTMSGDVDGFQWGPGSLLPVTAEKREEEDTTRQPLIIIHGWQANRDPDKIIPDSGVYKNRDPIELSKQPDNNHYDAEGYWWTFLRYFNTNDDLKKKYKIYLYQYPSYKHITFNARMLSNMLYEVKYIRDWINSGEKITILAHSMGGLVSRSFLEEHGGIWFREAGDWDLFKSGENLLDKLITLDTPHHGSPAAVYPWIDAADDPLIGKDLYSPGALDLWWDGYDGVYNEIEGTNLDECPGGPPSGIDADDLNSWRDSNEWDFELYYRNKVMDWDNRELGTIICPPGVQFYVHPNPWLTHLNEKIHLPSKSEWQYKYIFYGGYNDSPWIEVHPGDKLEDTGLYDAGDNAYITGVWKAGYLNDSPVPVTSSFFDTTGEDCFSNPELCCEKGILSRRDNECVNVHGWPDTNKIGMLWVDFVWDDGENVLKTTNEGFQIRFFKDYHHDRMLHGAYYHSSRDPKKNRGGMTPDDPASCTERGVWKWDLITNSELTLPCDANENESNPDWDQRIYTGFRNSAPEDSPENFRLDYIKDTGERTLNITNMWLFDNNDATDANWKSTLEYEPLFLMLKQDLLALPGDVDGSQTVDIADVILVLQILAGNDPVQNARYADADFDGKITMVEAIYAMQIASESPDEPIPPLPVVSLTGRVWMDRNLGASQVATSSTDVEAYGDLYEWGRLSDGHEDRMSLATGTKSTTDIPGHGYFILSTGLNLGDWRDPSNNTLWQGVSNVNNPCPSGFRLPTETELDAERLSWSSNDSAGAFASPLKLVMAGYRDHFDDHIWGLGVTKQANYWSSSVGSGTYCYYLGFNSDTAYMSSKFRTNGMSVRCIKD